ncbi:MAG: hypothetical protein CMI53_05315 [Parcubacteria group bacterium]|jgi:hypothetical protein|nr:hypothetical protein [Parcubacteria group bacterium]|tara:strand:+ start:179 stop:1780 length:1602 start_codon:yes stop_codon:yes gene_type:complete
MRKIFLTISGVTIFSLALGLPLAALAAVITFDGTTTLAMPNGRNVDVLTGSTVEAFTVNDDSTLSLDLASDSNVSLEATDSWIMSVSPEIAQNSCSGTTASMNITSATTQTVTVTISGDLCGAAGGGPGGGGGGGGGGGVPAVPPTETSAVINGGNDQTDSVNVTLTLAATSATLMLVSNTSDFSDSDSTWEDYATSKSWTLTSDLGTKTVYVKYRSSSGGESAAVTDTIELVAATEPESSDVSGSAGGSVSLSDDSAAVSVPAGAITGSGTVSITPTTSYTSPGGSDKIVGGKVYDLLLTVDGSTVATFDEFVTLTFSYNDGDVSGIDESTLSIKYWSEATAEWLDLGGTVDSDNNTVTVETAHFTQFAIVGQQLSGGGELVKLECAADAGVNDPCKAVYYLGDDGKRYVFPNEKTYNTWYSDFSSVTTISADDLATYMIGGNVTYRPGVKLVKIQTNSKVYAISGGGVLRWVSTGEAAEGLYGSSWASMVEDIPDAFFINYTEGADIAETADYDKAAILNVAVDINTDKGL